MNPSHRSFLFAALFTAGLWLSPGAGFAQDSTLVITQANDGATFSADLDQPIEIDLEGNPSTGFAWTVASVNGSSVVTNGPSEFTSSGLGVGGGGTFSFPFIAVGPGDTTLVLEYSQAWEGIAVTNFSVTSRSRRRPPWRSPGREPGWWFPGRPTTVTVSSWKERPTWRRRPGRRSTCCR